MIGGRHFKEHSALIFSKTDKFNHNCSKSYAYVENSQEKIRDY